MVQVVIVGGAGSEFFANDPKPVKGVGHNIVEELVSYGKHGVSVWTRKNPSEAVVPAGAQVVQVTDYTDPAALVSLLQGVDVVLAFINPMTDPGNRTQKALIDACIAAGVKRYGPSEWAGKTKSSIAMYAHKAEVLDYLAEVNKEKKVRVVSCDLPRRDGLIRKQVLEYGIFQPGLLMDYFASPFPPSDHMNTFPLLFDLLGARAVIVEDGKAPMSLTAASDVGKVVAHAIESDEPWSLRGGIVGEKTNMLKIVETAEKITGRKFELHHVKVADLEAGEWKAKWQPTFDETLPPQKVKELVVPFVSGWALGIWNGLIDLEPDWNKRFPDIKFVSVEEMLQGAWNRAKAAGRRFAPFSVEGMQDSDHRPTPSLSDRFFALFNAVDDDDEPAHAVSEPPSRSSADRPRDMRHVRTRPPSPFSSHPSHRPNASLPRGPRRPHPRPMSLSSTPPPSSSSTAATTKRRRDAHAPAQSAPLPVLRWFAPKQPAQPPPTRTDTPARPDSPPLTYSDSPIGTSDSASSSVSHLSALADALHDDPNLRDAHAPSVDLPSRPEAARLPPSLRPWRPPSHLAELSRSTLPTACLSPTTAAPPYTDPFADPFAQPEHNPDLDIFFSPTPIPLAFPHSPAPAHLNRSPPMLSSSSTRSSLDTLRSIQERSMHTSTTPPGSNSLFPTLPTLPNPLSWFSQDDESAQHERIQPFLSEHDRAPTAASQKARIRSHYASPKHPVVFCHGLLGFDTVTLGPSIAPLQVAHWRGIKDALEANGTEVLITRVPATSSPVERAKVLEEKISEVYPGRAKRKFKVLSITTIATPHRGSSFADRFLETVGRERMPSILSLLDLLPNGGGDGSAFEFLTVGNMKKFNENTPDVPGVKYYSWGAVYEPGLIDTWK
ncbi:hypothetical protein EIP86_010537 [Pleurotus ostreatoroseus]|nr:hypothetical protein EIP86_010537 [Pleurotus ostreatoroseus]